ncbi:hypothetical protein [Corallococcus llansteffanensis]|uniref:hypothetical protein n=1 Tax=Corallococcus llansteffanensis TaxID=2316731 RepID=UPI001FC93C76|nr:hypothetical protein [Corallococcus llansteffanensis]
MAPVGAAPVRSGPTGALRLLPLAGRWLLTQAGVSDAGVLDVTLCEEFFGGALTTVMFAFMIALLAPLRRHAPVPAAAQPAP